MIPFQLLFYPPTIFRRYPVRHWRDVTLWLKWGILIALGSVLMKVAMLDSPESSSYVFGLLSYLGEQNDAITLTFPIKFGIFFLVEIFVIVMIWLFRAACIFVAYNFLDDAPFSEGKIALSIAGASLVNGIWLILPGFVGYLFATAHGIFLLAYLTSQINRLDMPQSISLSVVPGLFPFII